MNLEARIPPPVVAAIVAGAMWGVDAAMPAVAWHFAGRDGLAIALFVFGSAVSAAGVIQFRRARTTVDPLHPERASVFVERGVFRFSRNPMYLGLVIVLIAFAMHLANALALPGPALFVYYMNRFQILPEERALRARFGAPYVAYLARVRRWI